MGLKIKVGSNKTKLFYGAKKKVIKSRPLSVTLFYGLDDLVEDKANLTKVQVECRKDASLLSCNVARACSAALQPLP